MPATDLSAVEVIKLLSTPYVQQRYLKDRVTEANLYKLVRAICAGFHAETGQAVDDLEPQRFDLTAEEGFLDNRALYWNVPRRVGEIDSSVRVRIGQVKLRKWGAFNVDDMIVLLATLLNVDPVQVIVTENVNEAGDYEPGLIQFTLNPGVFTDNGITDVAAAILSLESDMEEVAPAGVRVRIISQGTAIWDDASTLWDATGTWSEGEVEVGASAPPSSTPTPSSGGVGDDPIGLDPIGS